MISLSTTKSKRFLRLDLLSLFAVFSSFLVVTFVSICLFAAPEASDATTVTASAGSTSYLASISNDDTVSIPISPTSSQEVYTATNDISYTNTCPAGFIVTIASTTTNTNLTRTGDDDGTKTISTISTGPASLSEYSWGFSKVSGNSAFNPIPSSASPVELFSVDETNTTPATFTVYYGVKTDDQLTPGSYTNSVLYTVSVPSTCTAYTLSFDANGGTIIDSTYNYDDQTLDYGTMINLSNYKPERTGYTFAGWSIDGSSGSASFNGTETSVNVNQSDSTTLTLTALWTANNYSITLNGNSATTQNTATIYTTYNTNLYLNSARSQAMTTSANPITIPVRTGYTFDGYYSGSGGTGTQYITSSGYATSAGITAAKGYTSNQTWYAKWTESAVGIHSISTMQAMTTAICTATTTPTSSATTLDTTGAYHGNTSYVPSTTLEDTRDNKTYTVRKLADGKCWMTDNLKLINKEISSTDSDMTSGSWTVPASSKTGFSSYNTNNAYLDSSYGGYYTFYTATAGWGTNSVSSGNSSKSICPKNWRLPTGGFSGEFQTLYNNYSSSAKMRSTPPSFTLAGYVDSSSVYVQGTRGRYWSSTVYNANDAYGLSLNSSNVNPASSNLKYNGYSVRCVAR